MVILFPTAQNYIIFNSSASYYTHLNKFLKLKHSQFGVACMGAAGFSSLGNNPALYMQQKTVSQIHPISRAYLIALCL